MSVRWQDRERITQTFSTCIFLKENMYLISVHFFMVDKDIVNKDISPKYLKKKFVPFRGSLVYFPCIRVAPLCAFFYKLQLLIKKNIYLKKV
jgi:hypothetical protein